MVCDETKRIVIIKNISSNIVEEAILVLRDTKSNNNRNKSTVISFANGSKKANNYLLKEAEDIINSFVKEKSLKGGLINELSLKPYRPQRKVLVNTVINLALVASIALLLFLVSKMF